jgi:N-methylhydantoinase B
MKTSGVQLAEGDRVTVTAGGGGGYGNPAQRNPERVLEDVVDGYVSIENARLEYGVAINPDTLEIDAVETEKLRAALLSGTS